MAYTYAQIEAIWNDNGGNPAAAPMAAAIAMAESGGNPDAENTANSNGTIDRGLWQINSVHGSQSSFDLTTNVQAAIAISNNGTNWQPWSTFNNGAYQKYLTNSVSPDNSYVAATTDAAGVSLGNSTVSAFTAASPTLSLDALRSASPLVAALVTSVPELQNIFQQAVAGSWSTDRFISAVQNSTWWSQNSDTMRTALATMKADPATWSQNVDNLQANLTNMAAQFGATLSQGQLNALAVDALSKGYDQNQAELRQKFEQYIQPISGLHFGGEAGTTEQSIRDAQNQLGVFLPEPTLDQNVRQITGGQMALTDVTSALRTQAAATYPAYANLINQGMNVSDIASPYISRAQQLLEGGDGMINIQSPLIKNALQYTQNGQPAVMNMGDFETAVRKDPRWVATDNAQNDLMSNAHKVLQDFGLNY